LAQAGLDALEVFHSDHDATMVEQYAALARRLNLLVTGGSDFHGSPEHGLEPGSVTLPADDWDRLRQASTRHRVTR
jgi:predicted metal-dependent phosphoesterase TrpH